MSSSSFRKENKSILFGSENDKLKKKFNDLNNLVNKLILQIEDGEYLIKEECRELRNQVQLATEEKIVETNEKSDFY